MRPPFSRCILIRIISSCKSSVRAKEPSAETPLRSFADRGFGDEGVAGHISVRDPILTDHFWLNPLSMHFSLICVSDLILVNEDGDVVEGDQPINAAAFAIHSESEYAIFFYLVIYLFFLCRL